MRLQTAPILLGQILITRPIEMEMTKMIKAESSSGLHTHDHEHNRVDPSSSNTPFPPNSNTDHHNPYHAFGGSDKKNLLHEHPHQHKYVPERENNMEGTDDTDGDEPVTYHFEESWFKNPLDYTELDYTENDVGSSGDLVGSDCYEC